jgi:hypothetical protein
VNDIPSEKVFGRFKEQGCKESCLKGGFGVDLFIGDDYENQTKHAVGEEEGEQVFQDPLNCLR